jgi:putative hemolysin
MKNGLIKLGTGFALVALLGAGCRNISQPTPPVANGNVNSAAPIANMPNPASANCIQKGGKLEMRDNKLGQYGVCLFEDNRQCEEWALMRGECPAGGLKITGYENDAEIYCAITGGTVEGVGTKTPMCKRVDGTYCNAQANLDGDCPDPHNPNPSAGNREAP